MKFIINFMMNSYHKLDDEPHHQLHDEPHHKLHDEPHHKLYDELIIKYMMK